MNINYAGGRHIVVDPHRATAVRAGRALPLRAGLPGHGKCLGFNDNAWWYEFEVCVSFEIDGLMTNEVLFL